MANWLNNYKGNDDNQSSVPNLQNGGRTPSVVYTDDPKKVKEYENKLKAYLKNEREYKDYKPLTKELARERGMTWEPYYVYKPGKLPGEYDIVAKPVIEKPKQQYKLKPKEQPKPVAQAPQPIETQPVPQDMGITPIPQPTGYPVYGPGNSLIGTVTSAGEFTPASYMGINKGDIDLLKNQQQLTQYLQSKGINTPLIKQQYGGNISLPNIYPNQMVPKLQFGGATRSDSLNVLNRALKVENYYKNKGYKPSPIYSDNYISNLYEDLGKDLINPEQINEFSKFVKEESKKVKKYKENVKNRKFPEYKEKLKKARELYKTSPSVDYVDKQTGKVIRGGAPFSEYYSKVGPYQFEQREGATGFLDLRSPRMLYDERITPQNYIKYNQPPNAGWEDQVEMYLYDPLAVTPWDMLKPKQRDERIKKYGVTGTPYKSVKDYEKSKIKKEENKTKTKITKKSNVTPVAQAPVTQDVTLPPPVTQEVVPPPQAVSVQQPAGYPVYGPSRSLIGNVTSSGQFTPASYQGMNRADLDLLNNQEQLSQYLRSQGINTPLIKQQNGGVTKLAMGGEAGFCYDAQGNRIPCPDDKLPVVNVYDRNDPNLVEYNQRRDVENRYINMVNELKKQSDDSQNLQQFVTLRDSLRDKYFPGQDYTNLLTKYITETDDYSNKNLVGSFGNEFVYDTYEVPYDKRYQYVDLSSMNPVYGPSKSLIGYANPKREFYPAKGQYAQGMNKADAELLANQKNLTSFLEQSGVSQPIIMQRQGGVTKFEDGGDKGKKKKKQTSSLRSALQSSFGNMNVVGTAANAAMDRRRKERIARSLREQMLSSMPTPQLGSFNPNVSESTNPNRSPQATTAQIDLQKAQQLDAQIAEVIRNNPGISREQAINIINRPVARQQPVIKQSRKLTKQQQEEADNYRYQANKQYAAQNRDKGVKFNFATGDIAFKGDKTAQGGDWGHVDTPAIVQTLGSIAPGGEDVGRVQAPWLAANAIGVASSPFLPSVGPALSAISAGLQAPLLGTTIATEYGLGAVNIGNLLGLTSGMAGANKLGTDIGTGYYTSDAPVMEKIATGLETGLEMSFSPGMGGFGKSLQTIPLKAANFYNEVLYPGAVYPIRYARDISKIKKLHSNFFTDFDTPEGIRRLQAIGIKDPSQLKKPSLTFSPNVGGSHYDQLSNNININFDQIRKRLNKKYGFNISPKAVYEHEVGHWLDKSAYEQSDEFLNQMKQYEEDLASWLAGNRTKKSASIYKPRTIHIPFPVKPIPFSKNTNIGKSFDKLFSDEANRLPIDQQILNTTYQKAVSQDPEEALKYSGIFGKDNYLYTTHESEPLAHLREMRQAILDFGKLKNKYSDIDEELIKRFMANNPRDRVSSFASPNQTVLTGLAGMFKDLPAVVPIAGGVTALGAASMKGNPQEELQQQKKGGWLSKYQEGGVESRQGGYTDIPFNYNSAWGGQFAMGGSIPGSVGFTYARTAGAAPSEGPYAKKTMPSAQDGTKKQKEWLQSYLQSPKYKERLKKEFAGKDDAFIDNEVNARLNNLLNTKVNYVKSIGSEPGWISGLMITKQYEGEYYDYKQKKFLPNKWSPDSGRGYDKRGHVYLESEYTPSNWSPSEGFETIPLHELGHAVDDGGYRIPLSTKQKIFNYTQRDPKSLTDSPNYRSNGMEYGYYNTPTEFINRIQPIRYLLSSEGLYDTRNKDFTEKDYNNMIKNKNINKNVHYQDVMKSLKGTPEQKKKAFIDLMNSIAMQDNTNLDVAKNGMTYYQHGLDWKPKTISRNGSKTKKYYVGKSGIQGDGTFAKKDIQPGEHIGKAHRIIEPYVDYEFTELGHKHNHSENPNVQNVLIGDERHFVATKPIKKGEELTTNYRLQPDLEQPEDWKQTKKVSGKTKGSWLDQYK